MYFLKNRFIETGSTGSLPVPVPVQVGPSTGSGTGFGFKNIGQGSILSSKKVNLFIEPVLKIFLCKLLHHTIAIYIFSWWCLGNDTICWL
jgi:hypothetical protein